MESWSSFRRDKSENFGQKNVLENSFLNTIDCFRQRSLEFQEFHSPKEATESVLYSNLVPSSQQDRSGLFFDPMCSKDSSWIGLKVGRALDDKGTVRLIGSSVLGSNLSHGVAKRRTVGNWSSRMPYCQVCGCSKDLRSSKEYYKRHRVCEVHSKSAVVVVDGIKQRFCQQCSRFHVLAKFDDGKRSCRKRLADHNEWRRKPHVGTMSSDRVGTFLDYNGFVFQHNGHVPSDVCQDRRPSRFLQHRQNNEADSFQRSFGLTQIGTQTLNFPFQIGGDADLLRNNGNDEINELSIRGFVFQHNGHVQSDVCQDRRPSRFLQHQQNNEADSFQRSFGLTQIQRQTLNFPFQIGGDADLLRNNGNDEINELSIRGDITWLDKCSTIMYSPAALHGDTNSCHDHSLLSPLLGDSSDPPTRLHAAECTWPSSDSNAPYDVIAKASTMGMVTVGHPSCINSDENFFKPFRSLSTLDAACDGFNQTD